MLNINECTICSSQATIAKCAKFIWPRGAPICFDAMCGQSSFPFRRVPMVGIRFRSASVCGNLSTYNNL